MNITTPKRTKRTAYLASSPAIALSTINEWRHIPREVNCMLAMCEIITALPPEWFTHDERVATVTVIKELYGDPTKFLCDLIDGSVSFVNTCNENGDLKDLNTMINEHHMEHLLQFGGK